ncbi:6-hydroxycyclohex-1-ene-1-carbonyl-CoA dehydrogenase [Candidatus Bathyarchaeota archaeon]|nr:6-hydroxycyclohex-1-ene-1-carbonyl-CoA dehydrogenase [Candidatus Bathyarchaeota archaeon]NIR15510.1 6-hydroxycyclohex-1-ene-1-carbonyl-CoA dehydrogenase [Desulfobacterales bacterium]NIU80725.1 6-hydroxycyclohex-1-ene-1-carbonyl-CoA dehydrogenase [Candidatus Bathyarchaeota archaeon]NIV67350.1 6-hydroxycyclohex-1-ene-1-carbonyl-CoA dehydrogenase [Candidatus Bathyarchaeota archaeon]NIW15897.1 6-hydroxycyclohex-1-ene-1-carbonyl-CoA dehydrogenase [Candidatus Bathyarchaeota archaeon]
MNGVPDKIQTWQMVRPWGKDPETSEVIEGVLDRKEIPVPSLQPDEALVEIAGCGVCHTDLGYFYEGVPTVTEPPLTLGHEISGTVVAGEERLIGKEVIVPAVMPCNDCAICARGRGNRCLNQKMPGNSLGIYGGFSSHIPVPSEDLCVVQDRGEFQLAELAVIADAVTTPYQACVRGRLKEGENVVVIGVTGGVGSYVAQMAKAFGAQTVIGIARDPEKLKRALRYGADFVINSTGKDAKAVREEFKAICKENGLPHHYGWVIFEVTGVPAGQKIALTLLSFIGRLIWIGYNMHKNEYCLSRLMAFDAEIIGTWGCLPQYYPEALELVLNKTIKIRPFTEMRPMSEIQRVFEQAHARKLAKRVVLTPDF